MDALITVQSSYASLPTRFSLLEARVWFWEVFVTACGVFYLPFWYVFSSVFYSLALLSFMTNTPGPI